LRFGKDRRLPVTNHYRDLPDVADRSGLDGAALEAQAEVQSLPRQQLADIQALGTPVYPVQPVPKGRKVTNFPVNASTKYSPFSMR
jgi:hypothetical protein